MIIIWRSKLAFFSTKFIMSITSKLRLACIALVLLAFGWPARAETEKRIAFVVGNAAYQAAPLATTANDAGLIAQTCRWRASMSPGRATSMAIPCARHSEIFSKKRRRRDQRPWCSCISPVTVCSLMAKTISRRSMRKILSASDVGDRHAPRIAGRAWHALAARIGPKAGDARWPARCRAVFHPLAKGPGIA